MLSLREVHEGRGLTVLIYIAVGLLISIFAWLIFDIVFHGVEKINFSFVFSEPRNAGREGGIGPILISTVFILIVALLAALPLGLGTAIFLSEFGRRNTTFSLFIGRSLDVLASTPSIVFGLFGNALFCNWLGFGFSILSGGLTLACMILPILIRSTEMGLSSVPTEWRQGAIALGFSHTASLRHVLLPAATPAMTTGLLLGIGRAMAETAALVFTSGYADRIPGSPLDSGRSLTVHIYDLSMNVTGGDESAYGAAFVLIVMLFFVNILASSLSKFFLQGRSWTQ